MAGLLRPLLPAQPKSLRRCHQMPNCSRGEEPSPSSPNLPLPSRLIWCLKPKLVCCGFNTETSSGLPAPQLPPGFLRPLMSKPRCQHNHHGTCNVPLAQGFGKTPQQSATVTGEVLPVELAIPGVGFHPSPKA